MRLVACLVVGSRARRQVHDRVATIAALRGGNWNNGSNAGVFALNLNNAPSNSNNSIGFRLRNAASSDLGRSWAIEQHMPPWSCNPSCSRVGPGKYMNRRGRASSGFMLT